MKFNRVSNKVRKWSRIIHRDLSFFFTGMILIYAVSGVVMNHRDTINPNFSVELIEYTLEKSLPSKGELTKEDVIELLTPLGDGENYAKHYFPEEDMIKVFIKGGSSLVVDYKSNHVTYEKLTKRPVLSFMTKLHYNPGRWWTHFSDIFCLSLIVITISGAIMIKGSKGLWGRGGIELLIGIMIPLLFLII